MLYTQVWRNLLLRPPTSEVNGKHQIIPVVCCVAFLPVVVILSSCCCDQVALPYPTGSRQSPFLFKWVSSHYLLTIFFIQCWVFFPVFLCMPPMFGFMFGFPWPWITASNYLRLSMLPVSPVKCFAFVLCSCVCAQHCDRMIWPKIWTQQTLNCYFQVTTCCH